MADDAEQVPSFVPSSPEEVGRRVRTIANKLGGVPELAKVTGISESQLYRIIGGESEAKVGTLSLVAYHGKTSVEWLATGNYGPPLSGPHHASEPSAPYGQLLGQLDVQAVPKERTKGWSDGTYVYVPMFDVRAGAGQGAVPIGERITGWPVFMASFIRDKVKARPEDLGMITIDGPSMAPDLQDGSAALINFGDKGSQDGGIYVLRMSDTILVKKIQRLPGGTIRVSSTAPGFEPFTLHERSMAEENADIIARVVWGDRVF